MTKEKLRKIFKQKRIDLSRQQRAEYDAMLFEQLKQLDWNAYHYVHIYLTLRKFNEPDTSALIQWLKAFYPQVKLVISRSDFATGEMLNYLWNADTVIKENAWGIPEPEDGTLVDESLIDLVLVPLLVTDVAGNRVGYGKGFYDRFLSRCRKDVRTLGLSYFEPVETISDVDAWDRALQHLITPFRTYNF
ncbi:5-formyltetrahydrofolate cyclo-ligase [Sphingobacterium sp. Mn56C]|uniref:5-formyltetrahydrofolate cyclo-ligase n=1 Tax=Sphingobacterium sp. Mn56C TaxID=3395261 RepID=UPI003BE472F3